MRQGYYPQRQSNPAYQQPQYQGPFVQPQYAPPYMQNPQFAQNARQQFKRSGAKYTQIQNGKFAGTGLFAVSAWRATKIGIMRAKAFPIASKDGVFEYVGQQNGHKFVRYAVEVSNSTLGTAQTYFCTMRLDTRKIRIDELNLVISPNGSGVTRSGKSVTGFFGQKKNR